MKNLYHPILKIIAEDYSPDDPESPLWRCDAQMFCGAVSWDINKRKALWFVYPPETIAHEIWEYMELMPYQKEEIVKIIEKYL